MLDVDALTPLERIVLAGGLRLCAIELVELDARLAGDVGRGAVDTAHTVTMGLLSALEEVDAG